MLFKDIKLQVMNEAVARVTAEAKGYLDEPWHAKMTTQDFQKIEPLAKKLHETMDVKEFGGCVTLLQKATDEFYEIVKSDSAMPIEAWKGEYDAAIAILHKAAVLSAEAILSWSFLSEPSHEALRSETQGQIRALRALGLVEKQVLQPAIFKRAHVALMPRGRGA